MSFAPKQFYDYKSGSKMTKKEPAETTVRIFDDLDSLHTEAAKLFTEQCALNIAKKGSFFAVLSGGKTPEGVYKLLALPGYSSKIDWGAVQIFWGDERCVGPNDDESNFKLAFDSFISKVDIPEKNIHRIKGELSPEAAARAYEEEIKRAFEGRPVAFDLVLLGIGPDGHTLSLFPGTEALKVADRLVIENWVEKLGSWRVTMTYAAMERAKNIVFLVAGENKAGVFSDIINMSQKYPASRVRPISGAITWLVDRLTAGRG